MGMKTYLTSHSQTLINAIGFVDSFTARPSYLIWGQMYPHMKPVLMLSILGTVSFPSEQNLLRQF